MFEEIDFTLRNAIKRQSQYLYGNEGYMVAQILLGELEENPAKGVQRVNKHGRSRASFENKLILKLDAKKIPRALIAKLLEAIKGEWNEIEWYPLNGRKRIDTRIRTPGGNILRYLADQTIDQINLCKDCAWKWNRKGELIVTQKCEEHWTVEIENQYSLGSDTFIVNGEPYDWFKEYIKYRDEKYYKNALSWLE